MERMSLGERTQSPALREAQRAVFCMALPGFVRIGTLPLVTALRGALGDNPEVFTGSDSEQKPQGGAVRRVLRECRRSEDFRGAALRPPLRG